MSLVIDIGNTRIKGAYFEGNELKETFAIEHGGSLQSFLQNKKPLNTLISSVHDGAAKQVTDELTQRGLSFKFLKPAELTLKLEVDEPHAVGADRIANCYGALAHFPLNDSIVVDIGTATTFDYVTKDGKYMGGAILPGADLCAKALHEYTDKLPLVPVQKPSSPLGKTTASHIQSGIYYGLLGAVERMMFELSQLASSPSSVKLIATGGATKNPDLADGLKELVDFIDPHLTLIGLHEILNEQISKEK